MYSRWTDKTTPPIHSDQPAMSRFQRFSRRALNGTLVANLTALAASGATSSTLLAQSTVSITPISDTRSDWGAGLAPSPSGRFFALRSYVGESVTLYDQRTRRWLNAKQVVIGAQTAWAPDDRFIATARKEPNRPGEFIWLTPIDTATGVVAGTPRRVSTSPGRAPAWSPDGKRIAFLSNDAGRFRILSVPFSGGEERVLYSGVGVAQSLYWSRDGQTLFAAFGKTGWERWLRIDVATGKSKELASATGWPLVGLSPDGQRVANFNQLQQQLWISSAIDGRRLEVRQLPPRVYVAAWNRDGSGFIAIEHIVPTLIQQIRVADGTMTSLTSLDSAVIGDVMHSPDGTQLLYSRSDNIATRLMILPAGGGASRGIGPVLAEPINSYRWSLSGDKIVHCSIFSVGLIDVKSGRGISLAKLEIDKGNPKAQCLFVRNGSAVRWLHSPGGQTAREHAVHEATLTGADRVIDRFTAAGFPKLVDDSLVVVQSADGLSLRNVLTSQERPLYKGKAFARSASRSLDGHFLVFSTEDSDNRMSPYLFDLRGGTGRKVPYTLGGEIGNFAFHPDGQSLFAYACLSCVPPDGVEKWDAVQIPLNGGAARVLTAANRDFKDHGMPTVSPDGATIAFESETSYYTRIVSLTLKPKP